MMEATKQLGYVGSGFSLAYSLGYFFRSVEDSKECSSADELAWMWTAAYMAMMFISIFLIRRVQKRDPIFIIFWMSCTLVLLLYRIFGNTCMEPGTWRKIINFFINILIVVSMGIMAIVYRRLVRLNQENPPVPFANIVTDPQPNRPIGWSSQATGARTALMTRTFCTTRSENPNTESNLLNESSIQDASAPQMDNPPDYCSVMPEGGRTDDCCNVAGGTDCGGGGGGGGGGDCGGCDSGGGCVD